MDVIIMLQYWAAEAAHLRGHPTLENKKQESLLAPQLGIASADAKLAQTSA